MNKHLLIKDPELFQGEKQFKRNKNYFEGWYYKNTSQHDCISFIPGICINGLQKHAFIQIITDKTSYYIKYDIHDFYFDPNNFYIKIKNNIFTKDEIFINIIDNKQQLSIHGHITYHHIQNIKTSLMKPNIMGPFSYFSFLKCHHAIITMKSIINGKIQFLDQTLMFQNDCGYIEKDWGSSFPQTYIWCQGNHFSKKNVSFMVSIADVPFPFFTLKGIICVLIIDNKEYRMTTYQHVKLSHYLITKNSIDIILLQGDYQLHIKAHSHQGLELMAPNQGKMEKRIYESLLAKVKVTLKKGQEIIFDDISTRGGLEIVAK